MVPEQACSQEKSPDGDENLRPETVVEASGQGENSRRSSQLRE
jgi:hypothetical protein